MGIQINVDFKDKDRAKALGAFWDAELRTWYIPDKKKISAFSDFLPEEADTIVKLLFL